MFAGYCRNARIAVGFRPLIFVQGKIYCSSPSDVLAKQRKAHKHIRRLLTEKDEADRLEIAEMIASLSQSVQKQNEESKNEEMSTHDTLEVPKTVEDVKEIMTKFHHHQSPDVPFLNHIMKIVTPLFKREANIINLPALKESEKLVVVGDLHGDLEDLRTIFNVAGWPSKTNHYVFNGDFVDRGSSGVEVVSILFCLKLLFPSTVHLLRGNHEDSSMAKAYGFFNEIFRKYKNRALYDNFFATFATLPLCAYMKENLFIVHGGLSRNKETTLDDIQKIDRFRFIDVMGEKTGEKSAERLLLEDLLWSDPDAYSSSGRRDNVKRGAGCLYGPAGINQWMKQINAKTMVRSHECVEDGYEEIDCGDDIKLFTVFSSASYCGGDNYGAVLIFSPGSPIPKPVQYEALEPASIQDLEEFNRDSIKELVCKNIQRIRAEYKTHTTFPTITQDQWNNGLSRALNIDIDWKEALDISDVLDESGQVDSAKWLEQYSICKVHRTNEMVDSPESEILLENHDKLSAVFKLLDIKGTGRISKREFINSCNLLHNYFPKEGGSSPIEIFQLADHNKSGYINYEEFCGLFNKKE